MKSIRIPLLLLLLTSAATMAFVPYNGKKKHSQKKPAVAKTVSKPVATADSSDEDSYVIVVNKSTYELKVYDSEGWYATYPVVFGSKDAGDKMREGDKRTPDGTFKVIQKKINPNWGPELLLDYPNTESVAKFNDRKAKGLVPKNAKIGGGIAIHSTRKGEEWTVDNYYNWTDGCISVKYTEMQDLFSYINVGTTVKIVEQ